MFLLDTNVISELRAGKARPDSEVRRWAAGVVADQLYLSTISVFELEMGVPTMERRDARQGRVLRIWLDVVLRTFQARTLPFVTDTAVLCAAMQVPDRHPDRDAMIAATAKEHGYTLVTRNIQDFRGCGVALLNPWLDTGGTEDAL